MSLPTAARLPLRQFTMEGRKVIAGAWYSNQRGKHGADGLGRCQGDGSLELFLGGG